jgi:hypothetical protein
MAKNNETAWFWGNTNIANKNVKTQALPLQPHRTYQSLLGKSQPDISRHQRALATPDTNRYSSTPSSSRRPLYSRAYSRKTISTAGSILSNYSETEVGDGRSSNNRDKVTLRKVLTILTEIIKRELSKPQMYTKVFLPPKRVTDTYYPKSVYSETRDFFVEKEHAQRRREDKRAEELVSKRIHYAHADNQRYAFDRTAGNFIANAANDEAIAIEKEKNRMAEGQSRSVAKALKQEGLWVKQQTKSSEQEIERFEHLLAILEKEQKAEINREIRVIGESKDKDLKARRYRISKVMEERADAADRIMRILQDYDLLSGADMATYLQKTLKQIADTPMEASALFQASLSGITNGTLQEEEDYNNDGSNFIDNNTNLLMNGRGSSSSNINRGRKRNNNNDRNLSRAASTQGLINNRVGVSKTPNVGKKPWQSLQFDPKSLVPASAPTTMAGKLRTGTAASSKRIKTPGLGPRAYTPAVLKTPRGRFAPIVMNDSTGIVTDTGFKKPTLSTDGSLLLSSPISSPTNSNQAILENAMLANKSKLPKGPLTMKSRAWLYNNMRGMIIEEDKRDSSLGLLRSRSGSISGGKRSLSQSGRSTLLGMSRGSLTSSNGGDIPASTIPGFNNTFAYSDGRKTPWTATGKPRIENSSGKEIEDGWYPHMGTMPAPISVAERALEDKEHKIRRDGRGLPPEEKMEEDVDPFIGKSRWLAKPGDNNFYPELERPAYSKSYAADKILRQMEIKNKLPSDTATLPTYRMSMAMAGAKTYGESANAFSFLCHRPIHEHQ